MLDAMSMNDGPSVAEIERVLYNEVSQLVQLKRLRNTAFFRGINIVRPIHKFALRKGDAPGSEAAWAFGMKDVFVAEIVTLLTHRWNKFRRCLMRMWAVGKFMVMYWKVVNVRYRPEGVFETATAARWNPLLLPLLEVVQEEEDTEPKRRCGCLGWWWRRPRRVAPFF